MKNTCLEFSFFLRSFFLSRLRLRFRPPHILLKRHAYYDLVLEYLSQLTSLKMIQQVCDVGCASWFYLGSLAHYFPQASFLGLEVDPARRYLNLYRRIEITQAYAQALCLQGRHAKVQTGDFENWEGPLESVPTAFCFFFPFVSPHPCWAWGLPKRFVKWPVLLKKALTLAHTLSKPCLLISVHQGEWEAHLAQTAYASLGQTPLHHVIPASQFPPSWPSLWDSHLFLCSPTFYQNS